jgi:hypothetical protein
MGFREGLSTDTDSVWLPAILAGVVSMPVTVGLHSQLSTFSYGAVSLVGLAVGYYYRDRSTLGIRVGTRMGLVGSLPVLWLYGGFLDPLTSGIGSGLTVASLVETVQILGFFLLAIGISTVMGLAGTVMGIQTGRDAPSTEAS